VVPNGEGVGHASGISLLGPDAVDPDARLLVVYANPAASRRPWPDTVLADRVRIAQIGVAAELDPISADDPGPAVPVDTDAVDRDAVDTDSADTDPTPVEVDVVDPAATPALADAGTMATADPEPVEEPDRPTPVDHRPTTVPSPDGAPTFGP